MLGHQLAGPLDEHHQEVEGPRAKGHGSPVDHQTALLRLQFECTEAKLADGLVVGHGMGAAGRDSLP